MQANAGLANLPAVALSDAEGVDATVRGDGEVDGDEHVEVMEATEEAEGARRPGRPRQRHCGRRHSRTRPRPRFPEVTFGRPVLS